MEFREVKRPRSAAISGRDRQRAYSQSEKGKAGIKVRKRDQEDTQYLTREFIGWDGEGVNDLDGSHRYILLANSLGTRIVAKPGGYLGTREIFDFLFDVQRDAPKRSIHVVYGGSYDTNMILTDLDKETLDRIAHEPSAEWEEYKISYRPQKALQVTKDGRTFTMYDVVSFFQTSFVKACDSYLGTDWIERDEIVRQKRNRSVFEEVDIADIIRYNDAELVNLCALMVELRLRLFRVGLLIRRWDGPGAVAAALLEREGVKAHMAFVPDPVGNATRTAYAGGRFEVMQFGNYPGRVYEYDVNSAYPSAMRNLPTLADGTWHYHNGDPGSQPFAVYNIRWRNAGWYGIPSPLWVRTEKGAVIYPQDGEGWYWSPEYECSKLSKAPTYQREIIGAWVFTPVSDYKPFHFIDGLYLKRQALKRTGDGAHVGIKLGLNSLYGKLAQQLGWRIDPKYGLQTPPYHQIEWAGYVTSHCRAEVYRAIADKPNTVIAFETDAVFVTEPLDIPVGNGLGEFEITEFNDITYVKSGMWFAQELGGRTTEKTRGIDRCAHDDRAECGTQCVHRESFISIWGSDKPNTKVQARLTRFVGMRVALMQGMEHWRKWRSEPREIVPCPTGKRIPLSLDISASGLHYTECPYYGDNVSIEFPIEWLSENSLGDVYAEFRREEGEFE